MKTDDGHGAQTRSVAVVLSCLFTAGAAHAAAGGGTPGPGGWVVLLLALLPVGLLVHSRVRGPVGLALAGLAGQGIGHVGLGLATTTTPVGASTGGHTSHSGHAGHLAAPEVDGSGWSAAWSSVAHLAHMGPAMLAAHLVAAAVTAGLVTVVVDGLRRAVRRFVRLLREIALPNTPFPELAPVAVLGAPSTAPLLRARPQRGPPLG